MFCVDMETQAIGPRYLGHYPPKPVGVGILNTKTNEASYYTGGQMKAELAKIWDDELVFHNASFDIEVAMEYFGFEWPANHHDTLVMAALTDVHAPYLSLKYLAEKWCGIEPAERDELHEWIMANVPGATAKTTGAFISLAPEELVAKYCIQDLRMTWALFIHCWPYVERQQAAYKREIQLQEVLTENSRHGVRVDRGAMLDAEQELTASIELVSAWVAEKLSMSAEDIDSGPKLAVALTSSKFWDPSSPWPVTAKGKQRTDKATVAERITDPQLIDALRYRSYASTILGTFCQPWLLQSGVSGRIHVEWNAVRGERGGARTLRLTASPTLQTVPAHYPKLEHLPFELPELPKVRSWILPDEDEILVAADFSGQELRLFAHFEQGALAEQYKANPQADLHQFAAYMMTRAAGREVTRQQAKTLSFTIIYGGGGNRVSEALGISVDEARDLIALYKTAVAPGLAALQAVMSQRYRLGQPVRTLGGRLIKGEPPKIVDGMLRRFDYKVLNLLIQSSGADMTKQAMVNFKGPGKILLSVHDELVISVRPEDADEAEENLIAAMVNALPCTVPMFVEPARASNYQGCKQ